MTFIHLAAFVWNEGVEPQRLGRELREALEGYVADVDGIESYDCGPDTGFTPGTADFGVVGRFVSRKAFVAYRDASRHQAILAEFIVPNLESRSVVQVEN